MICNQHFCLDFNWPRTNDVRVMSHLSAAADIENWRLAIRLPNRDIRAVLRRVGPPEPKARSDKTPDVTD